VDQITIVLKSADGKVLYTETAPARTFSSGKSGFGAYGKVPLPDGSRAQLSFNLVKIAAK
jgi:hypothetical protein